jgi:sugar O-acyltransferase (sialic acid O-acetyltransferase NeuD family)
MNKKVAILGAGVLGQHLAHFITHYSKNKVIAFFDDSVEKKKIIEGIPVLGTKNELSNFKNKFDELAIAIGYKHLEKKESLVQEFKKLKIDLYSFIHPNTIIDKSAKIGQNVIIFPGSIIGRNAIINDSVVIHNNVVVSHDSKVGSCSFLGPNTAIAGNVSIGNSCFLGIGTIVKDNISITDNCIIGAGSLVIKPILEKGTYISETKMKKI